MAWGVAQNISLAGGWASASGPGAGPEMLPHTHTFLGLLAVRYLYSLIPHVATPKRTRPTGHCCTCHLQPRPLQACKVWSWCACLPHGVHGLASMVRPPTLLQYISRLAHVHSTRPAYHHKHRPSPQHRTCPFERLADDGPAVNIGTSDGGDWRHAERIHNTEEDGALSVPLRQTRVARCG